MHKDSIPGGLLLEEIPGILNINICADRESSAICPVDSYAASLSSVYATALQGIYPVFPVAGEISQYPRRGNQVL